MIGDCGNSKIRYFEISVMTRNLDEWYTMAIQADHVPNADEAFLHVRTIEKNPHVVGVEVLGELTREDVERDFHHEGMDQWPVLSSVE